MKYLMILVTACLLVSSCEKEKPPLLPPPAPTDVYVAGYERNGNGKTVATVWKNGTAQSLTNGNNDAVAKSVFVQGTDVYAAGYEKNESNIPVAKVWKNGTLLYTLSDGDTFSMANSVYFFGGSVYAAGIENNGSKDIAVVWRNNDPWELSYSGNNAWAHSVFLIHGQVRVAGFENNGTTNKATYWKNETPDEYTIWAYTPNSDLTNGHDLTDGDTDALATSVCIWNYSEPYAVYYAGYERNSDNKMVAKIWKPSGPQSLTDGTNDGMVNSLFVTENDLYAAGNEMTADLKFTAKLWKNGELTNLPSSSNANAYSVFVSGSDVYVAGVEYSGGTNSAAKLWKNSESTDLSANGAAALSVFVVQTP